MASATLCKAMKRCATR